MRYYIEHLPMTIPMGVQSENNAEAVEFDVSDWLARDGSLSFSVWVTRPGETEAYQAANTLLRDGILSWWPTGADTAIAGEGKVEILAVSANRRMLSGWTATYIRETTTETTTDAPVDQRPWLDQALLASEEAKAAAKSAAASAEQAEGVVKKEVAALTEDIVPGKNLFDASVLVDSAAWELLNLSLEPNTTYVFSCNLPYSLLTTMRMYVFNSSGAADYTTQSHAGKNRIVTTNADGILCLQYQNQTAGTLHDYWYQLEIGTTATEYEPYETKKSERLIQYAQEENEREKREKTLKERQLSGYSHKSFSCAAHRGKNDVAPENTIHAFRAAVNAGFDVLESDIWFTTDGVPVMLHDPTIDRTSNGSGASNSFSYDELLSLDFGGWFSPDFAGAKIMTFTEFCEFCRATGRRALIEIKDPTATEDEIQLVLDIAKEYGLEREICWGANMGENHKNLYVLLDKAPYADLQIISENGLTEDTIHNALELQNGRNRVYVCSGVWSDEFVNLCKKHGIGIAVFLVDDVQTALALPMYITYAISNQLNANQAIFNNAMGD